MNPRKFPLYVDLITLPFGNAIFSKHFSIFTNRFGKLVMCTDEPESRIQEDISLFIKFGGY